MNNKDKDDDNDIRSNNTYKKAKANTRTTIMSAALTSTIATSVGNKAAMTL